MRALQKHGKGNFKTEILEWCQSREELNEREKFWISEFDAVNSPMFYNIAHGGEGMSSEDVMGEKNPFYGKHHSEDSLKKMHRSHRSTPKSEETKRKMSEAQRGEKGNMYHKVHSGETKRKMSEAQCGEKNPFYGKHHSEETCIKISRSKMSGVRGYRGSRSVIQYSLDGVEMARFSSIAKAGDSSGIDSRRISDACRGHFYSIGGFIWRYEYDACKSFEELQKLYPQ